MQKKIFIWFVLIIVIPSGIIYFVTNHFFLNHSINERITTNTQLIGEMRKNLDTKLNHYQQLTMQFYLNEQAMKEITSDTPIWACTAIKNQLDSFVNSNRLIVSAYLYTDKGTIYRGHGLRQMDTIHTFYQEMLSKKNGRILWTKTFPLISNYGLADTYFFGARHIRAQQKPIATLYLGFNSMFFFDFFQDTPFTEDQIISIFQEDGEFIASNTPRDQDIPSLFTEKEIHAITESASPYERNLDTGEKEITLSSASRVSDWIILLSLSPKNILSDLTIIKKVFYISLIFYFLFSIYLSYLISRKLCRPLRKLTWAINQVGDGSLDITVEENHIDEIRQLSESFNDMTSRIQLLLLKIKQEEQDKRKAYMQTLQLQLTPHFLYNTLNTIRWMAQINGQENIKQTTKALISYLKSLTDIESEYITVKKELSLIEDYATIQRYRYKEFKIIYQVPEELKDLYIHKLMILNLVENSIIHGFSEKFDQGEVIISAKTESQVLSITVEDNGVGIDEKTLVSVKKELSEEQHQIADTSDHYSGHIGILNIQGRIRLYHGPGYGVTICSEPGNGCAITITQPIIQKDTTIE